MYKYKRRVKCLLCGKKYSVDEISAIKQVVRISEVIKVYVCETCGKILLKEKKDGHGVFEISESQSRKT